MRFVHILPQADKDLDNFFLYIAEDDVSVANLFLDKVEETFALLAEFSKLGVMFQTDKSELLGVRWFSVKGFPNHLVFYTENKSKITIIRLLHKAQNISHIL